MFGAGLSAGLVRGGGDNGYDENKQYKGILGMTQKLMKQAKLNKAKQSVNYGRTPGSSGRTYDEEVKMQETIKRKRAEKLQMLLNQGDLSTSFIGSASMIPPGPSSLVSPFSKKAKNTANSIYGDTSQRQQSLAKPPLFFKDQTGDGKITRADVIKARTEGYKK